MRRPVVVRYDVAGDRDRALVRAALRPVADWYQQSLWVVAPAVGLGPLAVVRGLSGIVDAGDRIRAVQPCPACLAKARWSPAVPEPFGFLAPQVAGGGPPPVDRGHHP